jgi:hypothetical protein
MTRSLVGVGVLLLAIGVAMIAMVVSSRHERIPLVGEEQARLDPSSRVWTFAGGLAIAAGAGCIGIGMNRWR